VEGVCTFKDEGSVYDSYQPNVTSTMHLELKLFTKATDCESY
jgi:hypothetical protein